LTSTCDHLAPGGGELLGCLLGHVEVHVGDGDPEAGLGERGGDAAADALSASGDEGDAVAHGVSFRLWWFREGR
jgi:hypothetical protein